jgi:hypothetical protein
MGYITGDESIPKEASEESKEPDKAKVDEEKTEE